jgi:hypothetical protein
MNDAGAAVGGVTIQIAGKIAGPVADIGSPAKPVWVRAEADGGFSVRQLPAGDYEVKLSEDTIPPGYSLENLAPVKLSIDPSTPGKADFRLMAFRSVSGTITHYDQDTGNFVPVTGVKVRIRERSLEVPVDAKGNYLFRNLAAGKCHVVVTYQGKDMEREIALDDTPVTLKNINLKFQPE